MTHVNQQLYWRIWIKVTDGKVKKKDNGSGYRSLGHDEKRNLPMFIQLREAFKETVSLIIWDYNYPETDITDNGIIFQAGSCF